MHIQPPGERLGNTELALRHALALSKGSCGLRFQGAIHTRVSHVFGQEGESCLVVFCSCSFASLGKVLGFWAVRI